MSHVYASANMEWVGGQGPDVRDLEKLDRLGATVIGVSEAKIAHVRGFLKRNKRWGYLYRDLPEFRVVGVLYRKDLYWGRYEYTGVPIGHLGNQGAGEVFIKQKIVAKPVLRVKSGPDAGKRFRAVNTHLVASAWRPWPAGNREAQRRRDAWHKQMSALNKAATGSLPAVGGGDLNGLGDKVAPYARGGWSWKSYKGKSHKNGQIDHLGSSGGIRLGEIQLVPLEGSDHNALLAPFTLPAQKGLNMLPENLPQILREAGLKVVEHPGWRTRKVAGQFAPVGVLCHHTATGRNWTDANVAKLLINGRTGLKGPLCQIGLDRDGTVHLIARGRANHAGDARASGTVAAGNGNRLYIGIEAYNDGVGEKWPAAQYDAYVLLAATLCAKVTGNSAATVRGHKETSVTGKIDPTFDMGAFRSKVDGRLERVTPKPKPPKKFEPGDRVLKVTNPRMSGDDIKWVQSHFRIKQDGIYGVKTRAAIRRFQIRHGIEPVSSEVGPKTWRALKQLDKK